VEPEIFVNFGKFAHQSIGQKSSIKRWLTEKTGSAWAPKSRQWPNTKKSNLNRNEQVFKRGSSIGELRMGSWARSGGLSWWHVTSCQTAASVAIGSGLLPFPPLNTRLLSCRICMQIHSLNAMKSNQKGTNQRGYQQTMQMLLCAWDGCRGVP